MVRESILMLGAFAALALAQPPPLRLNPMSSATPEQLRILGRAPTPFELNWGIFVDWSEIPGGVFQLSVPEGFLTLRDRAFRFVCSQKGWKGRLGIRRAPPVRSARSGPSLRCGKTVHDRAVRALSSAAARPGGTDDGSR
jgi:hypothetical protein